MTTPTDWLLYVAFRIQYALAPPKPRGLPAAITIHRGTHDERLIVKKESA